MQRVVSDRWRSTPGDVALAAGVAAVLVVGALVTQSHDVAETRLSWWGAALLVGSAVPLIWRRSFPMAVAVLVGLQDALYGVASQPDPPLQVATLVALYTVASTCTRRSTLALVIVVPAAVVAVNLAIGDAGSDDYYRAVLPLLVALVVGDRVRERQAEAERARARTAHDAVVTERRRIARELHDVVAHHVTMAVVQAEAGAAQAQVAGDAAAADRFDAIADTGRGAMAELRRLLGVLHDDDGPAAVEPQPGLAGVPALIDRVRAAGLPVDLVTTGQPRALPDGIDVSAYRIVQEALTNVVRHAGSAPTTVRIGWSPSAIELDVCDDGDGDVVSATPPDPAGGDSAGASAGGVGDDGGQGLVGIRERVALLGGQLQFGRRPSGGHRLVARLPLPAEAGA